MRNKARKGRKKARKDKKAREQDANTDETLVPSGLRRATSRFALPRSTLNFDKYDHKFKREHVTASVTFKQDEKYN